MNKKSTIIIVAFGLCALFFIAINLQNILLKGSFESEYTPLEADYIVSATFKRCNINILNPEFAKITEYKDEQEINIAFYTTDKILSQTEADWDNSYTGGTTIENATFPELVKMVKDDCSQFQKAKGDPADTTINWSYSPYKPEPPKEPKVEYTEAMAETMRARAIEIGRIKRELEKQKE